MNACALIAGGAIVVLAVPVAAGARTIPVKDPVGHVKVAKIGPAKRVVPGVVRRVVPRQLCVCVSLPVDRAMVQAQADFEAAFTDRMLLLHGLESWQWVEDPAAVAAFNGGMAAVVAGTGSIEEILAGIEVSW